MQRCASVRKKGSLDPCPVPCLRGHTLCGRHARCKTPVLWVNVHQSRHSGLVRAQALIRGHLVRARLALAGPGVLRRSGLANDEDLATMTETRRIPPFDYVSFEENGKVWAFEFPTLFAWVLRSEVPANPYTKVPLTTETRRRLFQLWVARVRSRQSSPLAFTESCRFLGHIFQDNGFADIGTTSFADLPKVTWIRFYRVLQQELLTLYPVDNLVRRRGIILCRRMEHFAPITGSSQYCQISTATLLRLLTVPPNPYLVCFSVLSCFYRC